MNDTNSTHPYGACSDLPGHILAGEWDGDLRAIAMAVAARRRIRAEQEGEEVFASLQVGDTVKLGDIRPKYMKGFVGKVTKLHRGKVTLLCTSARRRFSEGDSIRVAAACCTKVG